jgi:hypothetical protein
MEKSGAKKTVHALALAGVAALATAGVVEPSEGRAPSGVTPKRGHCHDMKRKRKRRMAKESRRRNR